MCFFTIHCNPSLANIAVRDLQSSQRNASVQSLLLAGNFLYLCNSSRVLTREIRAFLKKTQYLMNTLYVSIINDSMFSFHFKVFVDGRMLLGKLGLKHTQNNTFSRDNECRLFYIIHSIFRKHVNLSKILTATWPKWLQERVHNRNMHRYNSQNKHYFRPPRIPC